jgi:hypothetical protein
MSILGRIAKVAEIIAFGADEEVSASPGGRVEPVIHSGQVSAMYETDLGRAERRAKEYFDIIESIEKERNAWVEMYRVQASEHLNAQSMLETALMESRRQMARAIHMLNKARKEAGLDEVKLPSDLLPYDGEPVGTAERYAKKMTELASNMPNLIDGVGARAAVSSSS